MTNYADDKIVAYFYYKFFNISVFENLNHSTKPGSRSVLFFTRHNHLNRSTERKI